MIYLLLNKGDWNLLDLTAGFYDITSLGKVGISSTYPKFEQICDIFGYLQ
jgi:hypothetical protein